MPVSHHQLFKTTAICFEGSTEALYIPVLMEAD